MPFTTDNQTIADIQLISKDRKIPSIFGYYNRTKTNGGQELLFKIIQTPFSDKVFLENRKAEISGFNNLNTELILNRRQIDFVEHYLKNKHIPLKDNIIDATYDNIVSRIQDSNDYFIIRQGIIYTLETFKDLRDFLYNIQDDFLPETLTTKFEVISEYLNEIAGFGFFDNTPKDFRKLKPNQTNLLDNFFRAKKKRELRFVMDIIYEIDILQSFCRLLKNEQFCLPEYSIGNPPVFEVENCIHPLIENPIPNSIKLEGERTLCFLTGPNMSGKSTFLKTVGIVTYLAHLGIPVPAKKMKIPVFSGLFTTINLSDSLSLGFSHFYAEVNRIRELALQIHKNNNVLVILDELFRGTNVKDAYDGTLMVVDLLSKIKGTFFFISTHIIEVAEQLANSENIDFKCFESILKQNIPVYNFKLKKGITSERVGMQIISNERIEEILYEVITNQSKE